MQKPEDFYLPNTLRPKIKKTCLRLLNCVKFFAPAGCPLVRIVQTWKKWMAVRGGGGSKAQ